jgi:hypothetical protein
MTSLCWEWDPAARLLTTAEAARSVRRDPQAIRDWVRYGLLAPVAWQRPPAGRGKLQPLYLEIDVLTAESQARASRTRSGATRRGKGRHVAPRGDGTTSCDQSG